MYLYGSTYISTLTFEEVEAALGMLNAQHHVLQEIMEDHDVLEEYAFPGTRSAHFY